METPGNSADKETKTARETLIEKQFELDTVLTAVSEEIEFWNLRFEQMAKDESEQGQMALNTLAAEAISSLDQQWPFMGDHIHVSGSWYVPDINITPTSINFPPARQEAFSIVESNGFAIFDETGAAPKVGLSFEIATVPIVSAMAQTKFSFLAYANPSEVSLYYVRPGADNLQATDLGEFGDKMTLYDSLLHLSYNNDNSDFYRKSIARQKHFLQGIADAVSDTLPSPELGQGAVCNQVDVPYFWRHVQDHRGYTWQKVAAEDGSMLLSGDIMGIGILELSELDTGRPIRSRSDLVDPDAGLCLIMRIEQPTIPDTFNNAPVYVPLRVADEAEIAIS